MTALTRVLSALLVALGVAMLIVTAAAGAGAAPAVGYLFGAGLVAAGSLRLYLTRSRGGA